MADDLIATARRLARASRTRPRQADLKRAVSTAYYAVFGALARTCADVLVGVGPKRSSGAWTQAHRALEHGFARNACAQAENLGFPADIVSFVQAFVDLQVERNRADYDPNSRYSRAQVLDHIAHAEQAIAALSRAPARDKRAFAVLVLLRRR